MNIKLLRKVQAKARKFPHTFDIGQWASPVKKDQRHPCGTVGCIAGNAVLIAEPESLRAYLKLGEVACDPEKIATRLLGLTEEQAVRLFFSMRGWPDEFHYAYQFATTAKERANIIIRRINIFIKTKGAQ